MEQRPKGRWRFSLSTLLLLFVPVALVTAFYLRPQWQMRQASRAYQAICAKGVDAHFGDADECAIYFKNGNVTDRDLDAFLPVFNGHLPRGLFRPVSMELRGSNVSAEAIERFQRAVPECEVIP